MLVIILALLSAIGYGASDFAAGVASRTASVIQVTLLACLAATVLAWGAAAGASGTLRLAGLSLAGVCVALIAAGGAG